MSEFFVERHQTKKRFGQHFLHEKKYIEHIIAALDPDGTEAVVEIGPGEGALTFPLLARMKTLTAIEIDRDLIPRLTNAAPNYGDLTIISSDVLDVDFSRFNTAGKIKVVGNLPYNVSTPLLFHVLENAGTIERMVFMLQKEVVDRMAAPPGSKVYGRLSVMLQARCTVEYLFDVPPGAFRPPPKVDSAVVRLWPKPLDQIGILDHAIFERVVKAAFSQRRKTLRNALRDVVNADIFSLCEISPERRAETLSVAEYAQLANSLAQS